jgi:hypothetical protein
MSDLSKLRLLSEREQLIVICAVLLDGQDAPTILLNDKSRGNALTQAAHDCLDLPVELRVPLLGSLARVALKGIETQ